MAPDDKPGRAEQARATAAKAAESNQQFTDKKAEAVRLVQEQMAAEDEDKDKFKEPLDQAQKELDHVQKKNELSKQAAENAELTTDEEGRGRGQLLGDDGWV
ncbi:MAG: hypothetical protein Q9159_001206 [Coniocarpon cinnabarinum]